MVATPGNIPEQEAGEHSNGKLSSVQGAMPGNIPEQEAGSILMVKCQVCRVATWQYTRVGGGGAV